MPQKRLVSVCMSNIWLSLYSPDSALTQDLLAGDSWQQGIQRKPVCGWHHLGHRGSPGQWAASLRSPEQDQRVHQQALSHHRQVSTKRRTRSHSLVFPEDAFAVSLSGFNVAKRSSFQPGCCCLKFELKQKYNNLFCSGVATANHQPSSNE